MLRKTYVTTFELVEDPLKRLLLYCNGKVHKFVVDAADADAEFERIDKLIRETVARVVAEEFKK